GAEAEAVAEVERLARRDGGRPLVHGGDPDAVEVDRGQPEGGGPGAVQGDRAAGEGQPTGCALGAGQPEVAARGAGPGHPGPPGGPAPGRSRLLGEGDGERRAVRPGRDVAGPVPRPDPEPVAVPAGQLVDHGGAP